jgi:hypothetical protein
MRRTQHPHGEPDQQEKGEMGAMHHSQEPVDRARPWKMRAPLLEQHGHDVTSAEPALGRDRILHIDGQLPVGDDGEHQTAQEVE